MGLDINGARFLLGEKLRGVQLGRTLSLGRQGIYMCQHSYTSFLKSFGVPCTAPEYADDFFHGIGAAPLISMDASDYEGASIIHDMNEPVSEQYHSVFDTVLDGGTLEHVFNFPNAIQNCMRMVKPGGQLILMTPWHNYAGHGFYQFSPELLYSTLCPKNGFHIERMLLVSGNHWYSVKDPGKYKQRVEIFTKDPILLYVCAKKLNEFSLFSEWPQQSDYSTAWENGAYCTSTSYKEPWLKTALIKNIPVLKTLREGWRTYKRQHSLVPVRNPGLIQLGKSSEIPSVSE